MRVYVAGVTSERQYAESVADFHELKIREGDIRAMKSDTRGDIARIIMCADFLEQFHDPDDAILMMDLGMRFSEDLLEKLRAHDLDMVSAHYYMRTFRPMMSVVRVSENGQWPFTPLLDVPREGLHPVALAGFGAVLIKRKVVEAVAKQLPPGVPPFAIGSMPEMTDGDHGPFGSDFYFFTRAKRAGYQLYLDASVECAHGTTVWLDRDIYDKLDHTEGHARFLGKTIKESARIHGMNKQTAKIRIEQLQMERTKAQTQVERWTNKLAVIEGQLSEREIDLAQPDIIGKAKVFDSVEEVEEALERGRANSRPHDENTEPEVSTTEAS